MIAPRPREQADPPSPPDRLPPDRLPPRRGGRPSSETAKPAGRPTGFACVCVARQGPVCSARALGAAALLALSGALALLARTGTGPGRVGSRPFVHALLVTIAMLLPPGVSQAQAQEVVLVSNMAEQSGGSLAISSAEYLYEPIAGFTFGGEERIAQQFTTGTNPGGYTLRSVVLNLRQDGGAGSVVHVAIHRDSLGLGFPGTQLAVLDTPADPFGTTSGAAGNRTFSAASALSLDARARYWVVLKDTKNTGTTGPERYTASTTYLPDETGAERFSIHNGNSIWTPDAWEENLDFGGTQYHKLRMEIRGTVADTPPTCTLNTGDLWCGVMTVGEFHLGPSGGTGRGYRFGQTGSLPDDEFPFDGDKPYRVQAVYYVSEESNNSLPAGTLALTIDQGIPDGLTLQLGNEQFPISNASSQDGTSIFWSGSGLNWSVGDHVTLRLRGEAPPTLSVADAAATEGDAVEFVVTLSAVSGRDVTVDYATSVESGDSATSGTDFTAVSSGTLTFTAGDTEKTFTVSTTEDTTDEENETFTVTLSSASNASISDATAKGTIEDDDLPVVTIARDKNVVSENEGDAGFTLTRVGLTAGTLAVTVEVTQEADRDLLPDGAEAMRTVTFAAGSATAALAVALENDDLNEVISDLTVEVQPGTGYTVGSPGSATVRVIDTDTGLPTPANLTASPGAGVGEVTLAWDTHALHLQFARHQYRYKTVGAYGDWTDIPNSGQHSSVGGDGSNLTGYTVTGLVGGQALLGGRGRHGGGDGVALGRAGARGDGAGRWTRAPRWR